LKKSPLLLTRFKTSLLSNINGGKLSFLFCFGHLLPGNRQGLMALNGRTNSEIAEPILPLKAFCRLIN